MTSFTYLLKIKNSIISTFLIIMGLSCQQAQDTLLTTITKLPDKLKEISGITLLPNDTSIYAINDSGNSNEIHVLNQDGEYLKSITIPGTKNIDWEDLTYDDHNNLYIGDFGNNENDRRDLAIYKVAKLHSDQPVIDKISFVLEDQKKFPPKKSKRNFDIEAFVYVNDHFYLFTKNRSSDFDGIVKLYKLKAQSENQIAKLIDTYQFCDDPKDCFISGAAIDKDKNKIALLTYNKVFLLSNFEKDDFFKGSITKLKLGNRSQKEGICFVNDILFISEEGSRNKKSRLYSYILPH